LIEVAEAKVVVSTRHRWVEYDCLLKAVGRLRIMLCVVIDPPESIRVHCIFGVVSRK
jgi:hypothetical protein